MNTYGTTRMTTPMHECSDERRAEVYQDLRALGADKYDLHLPETRCLPQLLYKNEKLQGVVYGKYKVNEGTHVSRGALVITDERILLIDKKPLFMHYDDISFTVVSGIMYGQAGLGEVVTLNTRMGDIQVRTFNPDCASHFVRAVEAMLFTTKQGSES